MTWILKWKSASNSNGSERACGEDTSYATQDIPCHGMRWGSGLRDMVNRHGQALETRVPKSHGVSNNMHMPDTPRSSQLYFQPDALLQNNVGGCISPAISANYPSFSDMSSIMARCKELERKRRSSRRFWETTKMVFKTLSKTSWKWKTYSAQWVALWHACRKAQISSRLGKELDLCQPRVCQQAKEYFRQYKREQAREECQLCPKTSSRSCMQVKVKLRPVQWRRSESWNNSKKRTTNYEKAMLKLSDPTVN